MNWYTLSLTNPERIYTVQVQLIHAAQLVSSVGLSLAEPKSDDSHTTMRWHSVESALIGVEIPGDVPFSAGFCVADLSLFIADAKGVRLARYALHGRTKDEGLEWLNNTMARLKLSTTEVTLITYDYDPLPVYDEPFNASDVDALAESVKYFDNTDLLLAEFCTQFPEASKPVVWPHHFDMAIEIPIPEALKEGTTISLGLCTVDETYSTPYYYLAAYPYLDPQELPVLVSSGVWNTSGKWVGAALPILSSISETAETERSIVMTFLQDSLKVMRQAIPKK